MSARNYNNTATPVGLSAGIDDTQVTLPVGSTAGFPAAPFTLAIQRGSGTQEFCLCTNKGPTSFTVTRGYGTPPLAHDIGSPIEHCVGAIDYVEANFHINDQTHDQHGQYLRKDLLGATGSFYVAADDSDIVELVVGPDGSVLLADSVQTLGVKWGPAVPIGSLLMFAGGVAPAGYLLADGSLRTKGFGGTDDPLYQVIGTAFNTGGEGTSQFRLPDIRGRMPIGVGTGTGLSARALAAIGGKETVALVAANLAQHNHDMAHGHNAGIASHKHGVPGATVDYGLRYAVSVGGAQNNYLFNTVGPSGDRGQGVTFTSMSDEQPSVTVSSITGNTGTTPSAAATGHENMSPFIVINFLIKR